MIKRKSLLAVVATSLLTPVWVNAEGFFVGAGLGDAATDFDVTASNGGDIVFRVDDSNLLIGELSGGYEFSNEFFVQLDGQFFEALDIQFLDDDVDLNLIRASVGYYIPSDSRVRVSAKAGLAFWKLEPNRSFLFGPDSQLSGKLDGTDVFVEGGVEYRLSDQLRFGVNFSYTDLDVGPIKALTLTVKFLP